MKEEVNRKFRTAKLLFGLGLIKKFKDLSEVVPYSVVARKLTMNNVRSKAKLEQIATILNIDSVALYSLISRYLKS